MDLSSQRHQVHQVGRIVLEIENYDTLELPKTFEELDQISLDRPYNFLMSLDRSSIDKQIDRLGVEAHMFWGIPKVSAAFNDLCKKWFFNDCKAYSTNIIDISEDSPTPGTSDKIPASP